MPARSSFTSDSIPEQAVGCYCCLLERESSPEQPDADGNGHVVCFLGGSEKGLNLYPSSIHSEQCRSGLFLLYPCAQKCSKLYSLI